MNIQQIRQQYPQYNDLSDEQLAQGLHQKFYADLPFDVFSQRIGFKAAEVAPSIDPEAAMIQGAASDVIPESPTIDKAALEKQVAEFKEKTPLLERLKGSLTRGFEQAKGVVPGLEVINLQKEIDKIKSGEIAGETNEITGEFTPYTEEQKADIIARLQGQQQQALGYVMERQAEAAKIPRSPAEEAVGRAKTFSEAWQAFTVDPLGVATGVSLESAPQMVPALIVAAVSKNPLVGVTAMGSTSYMGELSSGIFDYFQDNGVNINDPKAVNAALQDQDTFRKAYEYAVTRANIIGAADAASAGLASKLLVPKKLVTSNLGREAINVALAQPAAQMVSGAGGEAAAQIATKGRIDQPGQVIFEAAGEGGTSIFETAAMGGRRAAEAIRGEPTPPTERVEPTMGGPRIQIETGPEAQPPVSAVEAEGALAEPVTTEQVEAVEKELAKPKAAPGIPTVEEEAPVVAEAPKQALPATKEELLDVLKRLEAITGETLTDRDIQDATAQWEQRRKDMGFKPVEELQIAGEAIVDEVKREAPDTQTVVQQMQAVEIPVMDLKLSKDVPQFKSDANEQGVVERLGGKFEREGLAPIQVWQRLNGDLEVISGRHRLDLARRSGEKTIPAQVFKESEGFDAKRAAVMDAELNIRDEKGKVKDYVTYFKETKLPQDEAESRGLLARSVGKRAYTIANEGTEELITALRNDAVTDEGAFVIAKNAPNDSRLQAVGIQAIQKGLGIGAAANKMQALKALAGEADTSLDMFGFDDSALKEAEEMGKIADRKQREIGTRLAAISGAAKNPKLAKQEGIDIKDPNAVAKRVEELRQLKASWENWPTNPELREEIRAEMGKPAVPKAPKAEKVAAGEVIGFKTAKGSTYTIDKEGKTSRTKKSAGKGQGTTYEPHSVLYVSEADSRSILEDRQAGAFEPGSASVQLGYVANGAFKPVADIAELPANADTAVAVINRNKNEIVGIYKAQREPAVGLAPVEKLYKDDGMSNLHIGNPIVELVTAEAAEAPVADQATIDKEIEDLLTESKLNRPTISEDMQKTWSVSKPVADAAIRTFRQDITNRVLHKYGRITGDEYVKSIEARNKMLEKLNNLKDRADKRKGVKEEEAKKAEAVEAEEKRIADREVELFKLQPTVEEKEMPTMEDMFGAKGLQEQPKRAPTEVTAEETGLFAAPKEPEIKGPTEEQRKNAEDNAKDVGGEVVWMEGDYALIRGYSVLSGDPVYVPTMGSQRARVDVERFTGKQVPDDVKAKMVEAKKEMEQAAEEKHKTNPFLKFEDGVALSKDISEDLAGVIRGWKDLLGLTPNIYVGTIESARADKNKFTGPHRRIGSGTLDANERGSMRRMADGSYYILFQNSTSPSLMLETIAHEMGHLHMREVYEKAPSAEKQALRDAHAKWVAANKGKSARELVDSLRTRATSRAVKVPEGMSADDMTSYWRSFDEWYADQTARWAVSADAPVTVVEKFFKRLGNQLRRFYQTLKANRYLPDETFVQYIEKVVKPDVSPASKQPPPAADIELGNVDPQSIDQMAEVVREDKISTYAGVRRRMSSIMSKVAEGGATLSLQRELVRLKTIGDAMKTDIDMTTPTRDSAKDFLEKALRENNRGNLSDEVYDAIRWMADNTPQLLDGLTLRVRQNKEGSATATGGFRPLARSILLYKGSSGAFNPGTIRHEVMHSLEQMMSPEARTALINAWQAAFQKELQTNKDPKVQKYLQAVLNFLASPTRENQDTAVELLPDYKYYQLFSPSEYWAVNAEKLMSAKMGSGWARFVKGVKKFVEYLKKTFGFDNSYVFHKVFDDIMRGDMTRANRMSLTDFLTGQQIQDLELRNIEPPIKKAEEGVVETDESVIATGKRDEEGNIGGKEGDQVRDLLDRTGRINTPMLSSTPLKDAVTRGAQAGKAILADAIEDPLQFSKNMLVGLDRGILYGRNKNIWFGSALNAADFRAYNGSLRTSQGLATASVALENAIRGGNIGTQVIMLGGIGWNNKALTFGAVEQPYNMANVYKAEAKLKKRIGKQTGQDLIQGYLEAKRSRSIQNEYYDRQENIASLEEALEESTNADTTKQLTKDLEDARQDFENIKIVYDKIAMTDDQIDEFIAQDKSFPELREIMDNWTGVNQNLLRFWRETSMLSEARYERLKNIKDYVPWQRIMSVEVDPHSPIQSTNKTLTNVGKEKLFKKGSPKVTTAFVAKEGQKSFVIQPSSVVSASVNGVKVPKDKISVTSDGHVQLNVSLQSGDTVVFDGIREIENIIDNMTRNVMMMTMNGLRNYAANRIVAEYGTRNTEGKVRVFKKADFENGVFSIINEGRRIYVQIADPLLAEAAIGMETMNIETVKVLAAVSNLTRRSITISGVFQIKQVFKDAPQAALVTGIRNPAVFIGQCYAGFVQALRGDDEAVKILKANGIGGYQSPARTPEADVKRKIGIINRSVYSYLIAALDHWGDASDMAQRVATYKRVLKESGDEAQAVIQAANVINFQHRGSGQLAQIAVRTVPFMGAYANSIDVLFQALVGGGGALRGMSRKKAFRRIYTTGTLLVGLTLLYCMVLGADDEYWELDDQTRLRNFIVPFARAKDGSMIMMPMNTGAAFFFKAIPELMYHRFIANATDTAADGKRLRAAFKDIALETLTGPMPLPPVIKSPVEIMLNKNFFTGREVTPRGMKDLEASRQYLNSTSSLGKYLSDASGGFVSDKYRLLNPIEADHMVRGLFGSAGAMAMWSSNLIEGAIRKEGGQRPGMTLKEQPIIGSFLSQPVPRGREDLFYDFKDVVTEKYKTYMSYVNSADPDGAEKYYKENKDVMKYYDYVNEVETQLKEINAEIRRIGGLKEGIMSPADKRERIDELSRYKNQMLGSVRQIRRDAFGTDFFNFSSSKPEE